MKVKSSERIVEEFLIKEILNNAVKIGDFLKPERVLAQELGYSRPLVHKAIIRLESRGLLTIIPRQGVRVNDYRKCGNLGLLESIYDMYHEGINHQLNLSMLAFIKNNLLVVLKMVSEVDYEEKNEYLKLQYNREYICGKDVFDWILTYALCCGNSVYAMLINEFKIGIINVGDALFKSQESERFINMIHEVDSDVNDNHAKSIDKLLKNFFETIENQWLRGGEYEK